MVDAVNVWNLTKFIWVYTFETSDIEKNYKVAMGCAFRKNRDKVHPMKRHLQLDLSGQIKRPKDWFGGSCLKNSHAKTSRPLTSKFAIHVVLRAQESRLRNLKTFAKVNAIVRETARKHGVRLYEYANAGNHLHLLLRLRDVPSWKPFIRELSGRIAQAVRLQMGAARGKASAQQKFWQQRPFTRVVRGWKKAYKIAKDYVVLNQMEAEGLVPRQARDFKKMWPIWNQELITIHTPDTA